MRESLAREGWRLQMRMVRRREAAECKDFGNCARAFTTEAPFSFAQGRLRHRESLSIVLVLPLAFSVPLW
jgi:hypothetical protein